MRNYLPNAVAHLLINAPGLVLMNLPFYCILVPEMPTFLSVTCGMT
ncbi:Uncharacterised protein [Vibrio cholerae]|nr:Uncharacterised protein [Vibrio cholerae]